MLIDIILLIFLLFSAVWTVMTIRLIRSIMGLAITSAILSVIMFRLSSPLAAVFELSVCSGLISVIFITTVSFTQRVSKERFLVRRRERLLKFLYLPFIIIASGILLFQHFKLPQLTLVTSGSLQGVREVIWNSRHLDILGQVVVLLAGVFGVVIFFKET